MKNKKVFFQDWGLLDYQQAWDRQEEIFAKTVEAKVGNRTNNTEIPTNNYLIFVEHPHVYTIGKSGKQENLLLSDDELKEVFRQRIPTEQEKGYEHILNNIAERFEYNL